IETSVGYQGGTTTAPTYQEVCTGATGHAEMVKVVFDADVVSVQEILRVFWENHDPTQGNRQGNDIGTQYRSVIYWTTSEQESVAIETRDLFGRVLAEHKLGPITTEIASAEGHEYFLAEEYHQKYLQKNPAGYDCHSTTGFQLPASV
ncbi:MAG: peptide-methionine (S)-S-oxide reductase MsrA, partial [Actinomycetota bacterium]